MKQTENARRLFCLTRDIGPLPEVLFAQSSMRNRDVFGCGCESAASKNYYARICNDADRHDICLTSFDNFDAAAGELNCLTKYVLDIARGGAVARTASAAEG